jgi:hypothetical protein
MDKARLRSTARLGKLLMKACDARLFVSPQVKGQRPIASSHVHSYNAFAETKGAFDGLDQFAQLSLHGVLLPTAVSLQVISS